MTYALALCGLRFLIKDLRQTYICFTVAALPTHAKIMSLLYIHEMGVGNKYDYLLAISTQLSFLQLPVLTYCRI